MQEAQEALNQLSICRVERSVCWEVRTLPEEHSSHSYSTLTLVDTLSSQTVVALPVCHPLCRLLPVLPRGTLLVCLWGQRGPKEAAGTVRVVLAYLVVTKWKFLLLQPVCKEMCSCFRSECCRVSVPGCLHSRCFLSHIVISMIVDVRYRKRHDCEGFMGLVML